MIVEFNNVKKSINNKEIIKGLSFSLPEKKMLALLGPNGAGKTTAVRLLMGLYKQDSTTCYLVCTIKIKVLL